MQVFNPVGQKQLYFNGKLLLEALKIKYLTENKKKIDGVSSKIKIPA